MISDFEFNKRAHLRQVSQKLNQNNHNGPISEAKAKKRKLPKAWENASALKNTRLLFCCLLPGLVLLVFFSGVN